MFGKIASAYLKHTTPHYKKNPVKYITCFLEPVFTDKQHVILTEKHCVYMVHVSDLTNCIQNRKYTVLLVEMIYS